MSRNLFTTLFSGLATLTLLTSCLEPDFDHFGLSVQARGLASNETITVSNGSTVEIAGNETLGWTEPQKFKQGYRSDRTNYNIHVTRQPSNSSKTCRILNPTGHAGHANSMVRIECGYPVVIADTQMSMTSDNGLIVSNQFEERALNASRMLVTSLLHEVIQDPTSTDQNDKKLRVTPQRQDGAITFSELYLEGELVTLSFSSVNQGCQITGANNNSSLTFNFPGPNEGTVQTIPLDADWIVDDSKFGSGRTCQDFESADEYLLDYNALENPEGSNNYPHPATCYPADPVEMTCGLALSISTNLPANSVDSRVELAASRTGSGTSSHTVTRDGGKHKTTFNLAFADGDDYQISANIGGPDLTTRACEFQSNPASTDTLITTINANTNEHLICSYRVSVVASGLATDGSDSIIMDLTRNQSVAPADNESATINTNGTTAFTLNFDGFGNDTYAISTDLSGTSKICEFTNTNSNTISNRSINSETRVNLVCQ